MNWIELNNISQLDSIQESSKSKAVLLFKHSTRCSISTMAKSRLERDWNDDIEIETYYLDLIKFREISNEMADKFNIPHQSPQALLIKNGECIYDASHNMISVDAMKNTL